MDEPYLHVTQTVLNVGRIFHYFFRENATIDRTIKNWVTAIIRK
jgi:hypothetical protein